MRIIGVLIALSSAVGSVIAQLIFAHVQKKGRISTYMINLFKTVITLLFLVPYLFLIDPLFSLSSVPAEGWLYLCLSGAMGFVVADMFFFGSFRYINVRIAMLIFASAPLIVALISFIFYGERLTLLELLCVFLVIGGIMLVLSQNKQGTEEEKKRRGLGLTFAFIGVLAQAISNVLGRSCLSYLPEDTGAIWITAIRASVAFVIYIVMLAIPKNHKDVAHDIKDARAMGLLLIAAFSGAVIGTITLFECLRYLPMGIGAALCSITPVLALPVALIRKEKLTLLEVLGFFVTMGGIVLYALT